MSARRRKHKLPQEDMGRDTACNQAKRDDAIKAIPIHWNDGLTDSINHGKIGDTVGCDTGLMVVIDVQCESSERARVSLYFRIC